MSLKHDHEHERKPHMSRLQQDQPHKEGLALRHRVTLDSEAHQWVLARTPTVHRCRTGKAVGGPQPAPRDDHRQTTTRQRQVLSHTCFQGVVKHLESYNLALSAPGLCLFLVFVVFLHVNSCLSQCVWCLLFFFCTGEVFCTMFLRVCERLKKHIFPTNRTLG